MNEGKRSNNVDVIFGIFVKNIKYTVYKNNLKKLVNYYIFHDDFIRIHEFVSYSIISFPRYTRIRFINKC